MTDILKIIESWGYSIPDEQARSGFQSYIAEMRSRGRIIEISDELGPCAYVFLFLGMSSSFFYKKGLWETPEDFEGGHIAYIDKLVCKRMNLDLRRSIQDAIETRFPNVVIGVYHRAPKDRQVIVYRRGTKHAVYV